MKISLKHGAGEAVVLDTDRWAGLDLPNLDECETCKRNTGTLIIEGAGYEQVEICPDCLVKALSAPIPST